MNNHRPKGDDLTPQSLLHEEREKAADQTLTIVDESAIGEGRGKDEAELAEEQPVGRRSAHRDPAASDRGPGRVHSRNVGKRGSQG